MYRQVRAGEGGDRGLEGCPACRESDPLTRAARVYRQVRAGERAEQGLEVYLGAAPAKMESRVNEGVSLGVTRVNLGGRLGVIWGRKCDKNGMLAARKYLVTRKLRADLHERRISRADLLLSWHLRRFRAPAKSAICRAKTKLRSAPTKMQAQICRDADRSGALEAGDLPARPQNAGNRIRAHSTSYKQQKF